MEHARQAGYPVPTVRDAAGADMVVARVAGLTMSAGSSPHGYSRRDLIPELRITLLAPSADMRPEVMAKQQLPSRLGCSKHPLDVIELERDERGLSR